MLTELRTFKNKKDFKVKHNLLLKIGLVENSERADKIIDEFLKDNKEVQSYQRDLIINGGIVMCLKFESVAIIQKFIFQVQSKKHVLNQVLLPNFRLYYPPSLMLAIKFINSKRKEEHNKSAAQQNPSTFNIIFESVAEIRKNQQVFDSFNNTDQNKVYWYIFTNTLKKYANEVRDIVVETDRAKMQKISSILFNREILEQQTLEQGLESLENFKEMLNQIISF